MIVLYSNHCPKCNIIKNKLDDKNIEYTLIDDVKVLQDKGFDFMPVLEVDGSLLTRMSEINEFVNRQ